MAWKIRTFIRHKDRQYKIETETDGIKTRFKKRLCPLRSLKLQFKVLESSLI